MKTIFTETFQYSSCPVQCVCVDDGEPWFRGDHVATILGYTSTAEALNELDDDDRKTLGEILASSDPDIFISVYGLHCLVYRSKMQDANVFRRWIWSDIITVIRRNTPPDHCSDDDDEESTCSEDSMVGLDEDHEQVLKNGPAFSEGLDEEEESLCDRLITYIHETYPDAEVMVGHGELQRVDGCLKGWQSGIVVIRNLQNGIPDVFAVDLNQSYESVVIFLHEHYKEVCKGAKPHVQVLKNGPAFSEGLEDDEEEWYDFATNRNPKYWLRKLKNKTALMKECDKRGVIIDNPMMTLNVRIIEALIAADTI